VLALAMADHLSRADAAHQSTAAEEGLAG
jgi:hypothetical protein